MLPDDEVLAEAEAWFLRAREDLRAADFELTADPPLLADVTFHSQQAVEKAMKGFLAFHRTVFRKTHNLVELGQACSAISEDLEPALASSAPLTEYAWRYRYPGDPTEPNMQDVLEALDIAKRAYDALITALPAEVRP